MKKSTSTMTKNKILKKIVSRIYDPFRYSFRYKYDDNISYVQGNE